jgi:hypothetical protein
MTQAFFMLLWKIREKRLRAPPFVLIASLSLTFAQPTFAWTVKQQLGTGLAAGCALGWAGGRYVDSRDTNPEKSSQGTVALSTLSGCLTGFALSYFFTEDIEEKDATPISDLIRRDRIELTDDVQDKLLPETLKYIVTKGPVSNGNHGFGGLASKDCLTRQFTIGLQSGDFIPVASNIIMPKFNYFILLSKDGSACVNPSGDMGYLNTFTPDFGSFLVKISIQK